ncbi:lysine-specific demethylase 4D-like [Contarinia nasturtii]|uniref:lysine-specific demethylase 4D-like n=1 Tax=Contarinia nasturtii TaxID=265458 RepID=UPI0012D3E238|nr:lysine-specific demethylase 4D-like [Contarinia nasturtii]
MNNNSILEVKVFRPTVAEFDDPSSFMKKIERDPVCQATGLAKIIPPVLRKHTPIIIPDDFRLNSCILQTTKILNETGVTHLLFQKKRAMTLGQFKDLAKNFEHSEMSLAQRETNILQNLCNITKKRTPVPIYAIDNVISRFPENYPNWNLDKFQGGSILTETEMPGINKSFSNYGMFGTFFGMHAEDSNMASINMLHEGAPKTWYGIPATMKIKLEELWKTEIFNETGCDLFIKHKALMYHPKVLRDNGIDFCKVDQFEGEMIVTLYGVLHQGFNHGFNCSEAINWASPEWKKYYDKTTLCSCRPYGKKLHALHELLGKFLENVSLEPSNLVETETSPASHSHCPVVDDKPSRIKPIIKD